MCVGVTAIPVVPLSKGAILCSAKNFTASLGQNHQKAEHPGQLCHCTAQSPNANWAASFLGRLPQAGESQHPLGNTDQWRRKQEHTEGQGRNVLTRHAHILV